MSEGSEVVDGPVASEEVGSTHQRTWCQLVVCRAMGRLAAVPVEGEEREEREAELLAWTSTPELPLSGSARSALHGM